MIPYSTLREFIDIVKEKDEVRIFNGVDWNLELACVNELVAEQKGPLMLFDNVGECAPGFRVATNILTTHNRLCLGLGLPSSTTPLQVVENFKNTFSHVRPIPSKIVDDAPIKKNIKTGSDVDILKFPTPQWHPKDGGRYIGTGALVVVKDPDEGWVNAGINRVMVVNKNQLAAQIGTAGQNDTIIKKWRALNKPCPIAICISPDPILMLVGGAKIPWGISEYDFAGGIYGRPTVVTRGPETGLLVPYNPEIVFEGYIQPHATCDEGPFGEWTGYIAGENKKENKYPHLVDVTSMMYCDDPILLGIRPLRPPTPWYTSAPITNASAIWAELEAMGHRGIKGVWTHVLESFGAIWTVVSIKQLYKGYSREVGLATTVCPGAGGWGAYMVIVDEDVDITNINEVLWNMAMRCDIQNDVMMVKDIRCSTLFPWLRVGRQGGYNTGGRLVFDACRSFERINSYPQENIFNKEYRQQMAKKWLKA